MGGAITGDREEEMKGIGIHHPPHEVPYNFSAVVAPMHP